MFKSFVKISPEGLPLILVVGALGWVLALLEINTLSFLILLLTLSLVFFFRDPDRDVINDSDAVIAPADGRVIFVSEEIMITILN